MIVLRSWLLCFIWLRWLRNRHLTTVILLSKLRRNTGWVQLRLLVTYDSIVISHHPVLLILGHIAIVLHSLFRKNWAHARTKHWRLVVILQIVVMIDCEQVSCITWRFFAAIAKSGKLANGDDVWVFWVLVVSYRLVHRFFVSALLDHLDFICHWQHCRSHGSLVMNNLLLLMLMLILLVYVLNGDGISFTPIRIRRLRIFDRLFYSLILIIKFLLVF